MIISTFWSSFVEELIHTHPNLFNAPLCILYTSWKAPLITCNPQDPMRYMGGISSFSLYSFIFFKTTQFVFGPSMANWGILSIIEDQGNPFKSSSNKASAVVLYWIVILRTLSWKHYPPNTKISPEGPFAPSPEQNYVNHQWTHLNMVMLKLDSSTFVLSMELCQTWLNTGILFDQV